MMWYGGPWSWNLGWFGWGGGILMILGFVLFIVGVIFVLRWISYTSWHDERKQRRYTKSDESLEILKKRYANGEITREEYEKMKKDLGF